MNALSEFRRQLLDEVQQYAALEEVFDQDAFFKVTCNILRDNDVISEFEPAYFRYGEGTKSFLLTDGYDPSSYDQDESVVIIGCDDNVSLRMHEEMPTITAAEYNKYLRAMRRFIVDVWNGKLKDQVEESSDIFALTSLIREHRGHIRRFRIYFITDRKYTGRESTTEKLEQDIYALSKKDDGINLEIHLWDITRLEQAAHATSSVENLTVKLGTEGIQAVHSPDVEPNMQTYLLFLRGQQLANLYDDYGVKLMESNVRSFLSMRGKVNKGIRKTINDDPSRFVAFNNGLTATASSIETNDEGNITAINNLQIVNGGQTTASIYYTWKEDKANLDQIVVPVKLVVVREETARELIPSISRFTNSQNKVAEADFSSNSEYQIKLEQASKQVLAPANSPTGILTYWYYERVRGQYDNEKRRLTPTARRQFEKQYPSRQRIKMVDATRYLVCWEGFPQIASLGAQKCFARFAEETANDAKTIRQIDKEYYKQLVCKRIIFDSAYKQIKRMDWYLGAYQMNIAEYAVAKYSYDLAREQLECDFSEVWRLQSVSPTMLGALMRAAAQASAVINSDKRPTANPSEWAKKDECWKMLQEMPSCLHADPIYAETSKRKAAAPSRHMAATKNMAEAAARLHEKPVIAEVSEATASISTVSNRADTPPQTTHSTSTDSHRYKLMHIPHRNWYTLYNWCGKHHRSLNESETAVMWKLSQNKELTDDEIAVAWHLRERMLFQGFPKSLLEPRQ